MSRPAFFALLLLSGAASAASAYDGVKVDLSWHTPMSDAAYRELVKIYNAERTYGCIQPPINR